MFTNKETQQTGSKSAERNVLSKNTMLKGDIISQGDFRIDGKLEGTLKVSGKVIVGPEGVIVGSIEADTADIEGKFSGDIKVTKTLLLKSSASISGDVITGKLSIDPGASFNATCAMRGAVKEIGKSKDEQKESLSEKTA